ncbi:MAG: redoxin domain-containing protein [Desulfomonile tiedjei]|uniref:Redoxin domain-containing protein n=1 Tax=Desulfomonile tiedjei TaxID=2358 RepID=A0A9D6Z4C6_9BACT|nr:redoxin domain-containing protein [Desulfomonile tiedjei]
MSLNQLIAFALISLLGLGPVCDAATGLQDSSSSNFRVLSTPPPAGDMILQDLKGRQVSLSGLRGKVVILNFWKIDCPPCSAEKPILERIYRKFSGSGLEIVAVNLTDPPDQLQVYAQRGGFSFTFAFDPSSRFSLRRHTIGPGLQTTFVVNPRSEAIYEIPGVPTTYVINRKGQVVGNSVGMVNWEDPEMSAFLQSLLQPELRTASTAVNATRAEEIRSSDPMSMERSRKLERSPEDVPPRVRFASAETPEEPPSQFPGRGPYPPATAQQGFNYPSAPVESQVQLQRPPQTARPGSQVQPGARKPATGVDNRPKQETAAKPPKLAKPAQPGTGAAKRDPSVYPTAQPPQPSVPVAHTGPASPGMQPLPPAMPYSPPRDQVATVGTVAPDDNGTVTARIPGMVGGPHLPAAQQVTRHNPIGGFILDSFGTTNAPSSAQAPRPLTVQRPQLEQPPQQQPGNIIQQIGQDFQNLGVGIKETFSRILPGK